MIRSGEIRFQNGIALRGNRPGLRHAVVWQPDETHGRRCGDFAYRRYRNHRLHDPARSVLSLYKSANALNGFDCRCELPLRIYIELYAAGVVYSHETGRDHRPKFLWQF